MKRAALAAAVLLLVAGGAAAAYVIHKQRESRDVRGSSTEEFVTTEAPVPKPPRRTKNAIVWPTYGYSDRRQRVSPFALRPPFRRVWTFRARQLLEFPPAIAYGRLYVANNSGVMLAVNAKTGRRAWRKRIGRCVAASPAVHRHVVFQAFLNRPPCNSDAKPGRLEGEVIAFASGFGKIRWRTRIGPTESSPLVAYRRVYVGDWRGRVYALDERSGRVRWTFQAKGRIKGAVARVGRRLYVGTYSGRLYALDAITGRKVWEARSQDRLGGRGQFYSTPTAAYGRIYIGSTDGKVYSFGGASGELRWSHGTGGYVYASPAVWNKTVFIGSYSRRVYALDAATGDVRWRVQTNGKISGSPTVMAGVVYVATLAGRTYALRARDGRVLWTYPDGKYTPVVADRDRLYLVGNARLYGLVEARTVRKPARLSVARVAAVMRASGFRRLVGFGVRQARPSHPQLLLRRIPPSVGLLAGGALPRSRYRVVAQVLDTGQQAVSLRRSLVPASRTRTRWHVCNVVVTAERQTAGVRKLVGGLRASCR